MNNLIEISHISKSYKKTCILKDINLSVPKGETITLTGHNGCGKSTLLKIICGLASIQGGKITYSHKLKFNYVPEKFPKLSITPKQYITKIGLIEGLSNKEVIKKSDYFFNAFHMEQMIATPIMFLSKGTMQKLNVIQAMLVKPDVLLLDEPLSGQDFASQKLFINMLKELNKQGVSIVMSCHEKFLINLISDISYEIVNGTLKRLDIMKNNEEYDILLFKNENNNLYNIDSIIKFTAKVDVIENNIIIYLKKEYSNDVIKQMMQLGFNLRRMNFENI
ncbi:ATP-binding cassette domain-containing protein [Sedimentibacter sp. zth1]|uniref:ATP-binding cassette domain-containing protein n=1 Tax=Sedimentibacter sp. zth1 TaxID=2816908 RepID=UPI001A92840D|nr:ATP-binding cassette domain-containing protein [Sedimentibacter sp. zth1]QSX06393.1 ATP-binding cassette domain-containing protein [Sedimentibacter sp. zth1]